MDSTDLQDTQAGSADNAEMAHHLFADNAMPMWVYDRQSLRFLDVNQAAIDAYGYSREEFLDMTIEALHPPEDLPMLRTLVCAHVSAIRTDGEWRHVLKGGEIRNVIVSGRLTHVGGRPAGLVMVQDITERKRALRALEESQQRYRSLFANNDDAIAIVNRDGVIEEANPAAAALCGYSTDELVGLSAGDLLDEASRTIALQHLGTSCADLHELDAGLVRKDGRRVDIHITAIPIVVDQDISGVFVVARDNTRRLLSESENAALLARIHEEQERLENLLASVPGVVWEFWDHPDASQGRVNYVSAHIEKMLGYPVSSFTGDSQFWLSCVHPDDREPAQARAWEVWNAGGGANTYRGITKDGRLLWIESHAVPIFDSSGNRIGMRGVNMDVTERVLAEEAVHEREERYRLVQRATRDVIWDWDLRTGELTHSDSLLTVFGYQPEQVGHDGQWWFDRTHPDDRESTVAAIWNTINSGGDSWVGEYRFMRGDDTFANVLDRSYITHAADGTPTRMIGSMTDITEQKRTEDTLRFLAKVSDALSETLDYGNTINNLAHITLPRLGDCCGVIVFGRGATRECIGVGHVDPSKAQLVRETGEMALSVSGELSPILRTIRNGVPTFAPEIADHDLVKAAVNSYHLELLRKLRPVSLVAAPLIVHGEVYGALMLAYTESGRHHSQQDLELTEEVARRASSVIENIVLYEKIQRADAAKNEFLAMLGHELRNPLGAVSNAMKLIHLRGKVDPSLQNTLDVVERQAKHMTRLVDDLLDVSRITQGKVDLRKEDTLLADVLDQAVQTAQPIIDAREHALSARIPPEPIWLSADPDRLAQVFTNLLSNAAKYTEPGGSISISASRGRGNVSVSVRDSGMGIAPDMLSRVFDLFTQAEHGLDRAQGGLGIGLTVVKSLVEMHGGSVSACSPGPGLGSEFTVTLPTIPAPGKARPAATMSATTPTTRRLRILLVEDNVDAAKTLAEILGMWGYNVRMAHDGLTALDLASKCGADVVLLDIGLPTMDGYEVCRRLRENPAVAGTTMVALTGYGQAEDQRRSKEAGFDHHLVKPVDFAALEALLLTVEPA